MFKKFKNVFYSFLLISSILFSQVSAFAADYNASTIDELTQIIKTTALERDTEFTVAYNGTDADFEYFFKDYSIYYYNLVSLRFDDPSSTDDGDYLLGLIDPTSFGSFETDENGEMIFNHKYFESLEETISVNQKANEILNELQISTMSSEYDKVKAIHDYICSNVTYVDDSDNGSSAYSGLIEGKGLCNSYALCMCKLLNTAGIGCKYIGGKAGTGKDAGGHAWNIVKIGGRWYYVDSTWDDDDENNSYNHDYFLKGKSDFDEADPSQPHTLDDEYNNSLYLIEFPIEANSYDPANPPAPKEDNTPVEPYNPSQPSVTPTQQPVINNNTNTNPNNSGVTGSTATQASNSKSYNFDDVILLRYPKGVMKLKRKRSNDIQIVFSKDYINNVDTVDYTVTKGKKLIKLVDYGMDEEDGYHFYDYFVKAKGKKGVALVKVTVTMDNGESKELSFKIKIK